MKKLFSLLFIVLLFITFLEGSYVGKSYFKGRNGPEIVNLFQKKAIHLESFFAKEIQKGNLKLVKVQEDLIASMEHHRYSQYFKELEVFGGQIIQHYRNGELTGINGEYYQIFDVDIVPLITKEKAIEFFRNDLAKEGLKEISEESRLVIYPVKYGDYYLAYQITFEKGAGYNMTGIIDARTGEILFKYSNVNFDESTIGLGIGYHGGQYKLPTTFYDGIYNLFNEKKVRPVNQYTYDYRTSDGYYYYVASDNDNYWDYDGALVNIHVYVGLTYDYYYLVHGRDGIDNKNMKIKATAHWYDGQDNAFWDGGKKHMYFLDPGKLNLQCGAAIDYIAHEYSHGVTQFSSGLIYSFESGALNESFSDIIGTAVEHYWQPEGSGFSKADWYMGEDAKPYFATNGLRNLANPSSNWQSPYGPDPCHLWQEILVPFYIDNGGVHLNMTIYSHAYYLLAHGGTNNVSNIKVNGVGIDKATKIFYRAWVYYMVPSSDFYYAACALGQSAYDLYGSNSNEFAQTIRAMEAIGWTYQ